MVKTEIKTSRTKSTTELAGQLREVNTFVKQNVGQNLLPAVHDSIDGIDSLVAFPQDELETRYPVRVSLYPQLVRLTRKDGSLTDEMASEIQQKLALANLDDYIAAHKIGDVDRVLREHQFTVFEDIRSNLAEGSTEGYIEFPTGTGKSVLAAEMVKALRAKTLIITPTQDLVQQMQDTFTQFVPNIPTGLAYTHVKQLDRDVTITTYDYLLKGVKEGTINPSDYGFVICDEAHKALTPARMDAIRQFKGAIKLGLSATPEYSTDKHVGLLLEKKMHYVTIKEAAEEGLISPFKVFIAQTDIDMSQVPIISSTGEYDPKQLERALNIAKRNQAAVDIYKNHFPDSSAFITTLSVKHAIELEEMFRAEGIEARAFHGRLDKRTRKQYLDDFKSGKIKVLLSKKLLAEGIDAPNANLLINLAPTLSKVNAIQRGGRVLRLDPNNPDKEAIIIDVVDENKHAKGRALTFAEVAGTAFAPKKAKEFTGRTYSGSFRGSSPLIHIEGLKVITNLEEVMEVINRYAEEREQAINIPEGFQRFTPNDIAFEFGMESSRVLYHLRALHEENPQHFKSINRSNYISAEGYELLLDRIRGLAAPEGLIPLPINELVQQVGEGKRSRIYKRLKELQAADPDSVRRSEKGWQWFIAPQLLTTLQVEYGSSVEDGFTQVPIFDLAREFGLRTGSAIYKRLNELAVSHPQYITKSNVGRRQIFTANEHGMQILRDELSQVKSNKPPEPNSVRQQFSSRFRGNGTAERERNSYESDGEDVVVFSTEDFNGMSFEEVDSFRRYMTQAAQYPLLSRQQENIIFKLLEEGKTIDSLFQDTDFLKTIRPKSEGLFANVSRDGESIEELVALCNLRLVIHIAKKYHALTIEDRVQEGYFGLKRAVEGFDYHTGNKFSTYATPWIAQSIDRAVKNDGSMIRIPIHAREVYGKAMKIVTEFEVRENRSPTKKELRSLLEEAQLERIDIVMDLFEGKVTRVASLDRPIGSDTETTLGEFVADNYEDYQPGATDDDNIEQIEGIVGGLLTERELEMLKMRHGIGSDEPMTLEAIGEIYGGLTRERVRQILDKAVKKLQINEELRKLWEDAPV